MCGIPVVPRGFPGTLRARRMRRPLGDRGGSWQCTSRSRRHRTPPRRTSGRIVRALADAGINIEGIAPDFDPPHVRVAVKHNHPYVAPDDRTDTFNQALDGPGGRGLRPAGQAVRAAAVPNTPTALQTVLDAAGGPQPRAREPRGDGRRRRQHGAAVHSASRATSMDDWEVEEEQLRSEIQPLLTGCSREEPTEPHARDDSRGRATRSLVARRLGIGGSWQCTRRSRRHRTTRRRTSSGS